MNVLLIQGGARKKGNTATVLQWVGKELEANGHEVETVYLHGKNLNGCMGCAKCKDTSQAVGCIQKDDIPEILQKMTQSQAVVFSSPLYFWGVNAQLKAVIDRTYSLYTNPRTPEHASLIEGQRQALLVTGAGPWEDNAEAAFTAFGRMQKYHKAVLSGELYIGGCTVPEDMDDSVRDRAAAFARELTA